MHAADLVLWRAPPNQKWWKCAPARTKVRHENRWSRATAESTTAASSPQLGEVEVDHEGNLLHVEASGEKVGGNEDASSYVQVPIVLGAVKIHGDPLARLVPMAAHQPPVPLRSSIKSFFMG